MPVWQVDEANGCEGEVVQGRQLYQELQQAHQQREHEMQELKNRQTQLEAVVSHATAEVEEMAQRVGSIEQDEAKEATKLRRILEIKSETQATRDDEMARIDDEIRRDEGTALAKLRDRTAEQVGRNCAMCVSVVRDDDGASIISSDARSSHVAACCGCLTGATAESGRRATGVEVRQQRQRRRRRRVFRKPFVCSHQRDNSCCRSRQRRGAK